MTKPPRPLSMSICSAHTVRRALLDAGRPPGSEAWALQPRPCLSLSCVPGEVLGSEPVPPSNRDHSASCFPPQVTVGSVRPPLLQRRAPPTAGGSMGTSVPAALCHGETEAGAIVTGLRSLRQQVLSQRYCPRAPWASRPPSPLCSSPSAPGAPKRVCLGRLSPRHLC